MTAIYDVTIVGGGAIGAACARELARSGRRVLLLEPDRESGVAWRAAAGMLAPQIEAAERDPVFPLALAARECYEALSAELRETTGVDIGFWRPGIVRVACSEEDAHGLRDRARWQRALGLPAEWLGEDDTSARWPWLGPIRGALWTHREAALDPVRLVQALRQDAVQAGATIAAEAALAIELTGGRVIAVRTDRNRHVTGNAVIAAGAWVSRLEGIPRPLPVVPVRGQMAALPWPRGVEPGIVFGRHSYVVARADEAVIGSTMEHAGFDPLVTREGIELITREARALCPPLMNGDVSRTWAGFRPVTPDGLPILGPEPAAEGLWYATGHGRNGILLAAITGDVVRRMLDGEDPGLDLSPLRPARFYDW